MLIRKSLDIISKMLKEYFIISIRLFLKKGGINSIIDLTISFEYNNVEENLESIILIKDKQLKIDSSFLEKDAKEYAFLKINI